MKISLFFRFVAGLFSLGFFAVPSLAAEVRDLWIQGGVDENYRFVKVSGFSVVHGDTVSLYADPESQKSVPQDSMDRIFSRLDGASEISVYPEMSYADLIRNFFGPFPNVFQQNGRLHIVLLSSAARSLNSSNPFLVSHDQVSEEEAEKLGYRSNVGNFLYVPILGKKPEDVLRAIVNVLPHFSMIQGSTNKAIQTNWLHHTLTEAALFLGGFFERDLLRFTTNSQLFSLTQEPVSSESNPLFPLFASFLLDTLSNKTNGLTYLSQNADGGKASVETLYRSDSSRPLTFDVIFGNFVSYLFQHEGLNLPTSVVKPGIYNGLLMPPILPYSTLTTYPYQMEAKIYPYGFLSVSLRNPLPSGAVINIQNISGNGPNDSCAKDASVLWKPITPKKIVFYSVGCNPISSRDLVKFRLNIFDKPSIFPGSPLRILPE